MKVDILPNKNLCYHMTIQITVYYNCLTSENLTLLLCFCIYNLIFKWINAFFCYRTMKTKDILNQLSNEIFTLLLKLYILKQTFYPVKVLSTNDDHDKTNRKWLKSGKLFFYWTSAHRNWPPKQMVSFTNSRMRILNFYWSFSNESKVFTH